MQLPSSRQFRAICMHICEWRIILARMWLLLNAGNLNITMTAISCSRGYDCPMDHYKACSLCYHLPGWLELLLLELKQHAAKTDLALAF